MSVAVEHPPLAGRGMKSFFFRSRPSTPDVPNIQRAREKIKGLVELPHLQSGKNAAKARNVEAKSGRKAKRAGEQSRASRIHEPVTSKIGGKVAVSALPIIQRGADGRWQAPSLSKGSISTSALPTLSDRPVAADEQKSTRRTDTLLSAFAATPTDTSTSKHRVESGRDIASKHPIRPSTAQGTNRTSPRKCPSAASRSALRTRETSAEAIILHHAGRLNPSKSSPSRIDSYQSTHHYTIRLATSFLVRSMSSTLRSPSFAKGIIDGKLRDAIDLRLSSLSRMEKAWGMEWVNAGMLLERQHLDSGPAFNDGIERVRRMEGKLKGSSIGPSTQERDQKSFVKALEDGILLCLLINHLFPTPTPYIPRISIAEDETLRVSNLTRFTLACRTVGLPDSNICRISDFHEASATSLANVAETIISLARLAAGKNAGVRTSKAQLRPTAGCPERALPLSSTDSQRVDAISASVVFPEGDSSKLGLQTRLDTVTSVQSLETELDDSPQTPMAPVFPALANVETSPTAIPPLSRSPATINLVTTSSRSGPPLKDPTGPANKPAYQPGRAQLTALPAGRYDPKHAHFDRRTDHSSNRILVYGTHVNESTPSLISTTSRMASVVSRSSAAVTMASPSSCDYAQPNGPHDQPEPGPPSGERRPSIRDVDPVLNRLGRSRDETLDELHDTSQGRRRERGLAISQSLAALEGHNSSQHGATPLPTPPEGAPLSRRSSIKRQSSNGKTYIPKRSLSPSSTTASTLLPFPAFSSSMPPPPIDWRRLRDQHRPTLPDRRQSESGASRTGESSDAPAQGDTNMPVYPLSKRTHSMADLSHRPALGQGPRASLAKSSTSSQYLTVITAEHRSVRYQIGNCIGRGQFGSVYRSMNMMTGQMVAVKRIRLNGLQEAEVAGVMQEVELLKTLDHPCIVRYEGMSKDDEFLNIILEYVENGSLGQTLKSFGAFNEKLVSSYVAKILEGLIYLHSQDVVHCDLKAANILSTKNGNIKLSDFGVSLVNQVVVNIKHGSTSVAQPPGTRSSRPVSDIAGTPNWMAPEVISLNGASPPSDIWALGCTIVELLTSKPPYAEISNSMSVLFRIVEDDRPPIPDGTSADLRDFLCLCFQKNPLDRPTAVVLSQHPWIQKSESVMTHRPQDSIPFLRSSTQSPPRRDTTVMFADLDDPSTSRPSSRIATISRPESSIAISSRSDTPVDDRPVSSMFTYPRPLSNQPTSSGSITRCHQLVKTSFGKPIPCRICDADVKRSGLLCQACGMICHPPCAKTAIDNCDFTEQMRILSLQEERKEAARRQSRTSINTEGSASQNESRRRKFSFIPRMSETSSEADASHEKELLRPPRILTGWSRLNPRKESTKAPLSSNRVSPSDKWEDCLTPIAQPSMSADLYQGIPAQIGLTASHNTETNDANRVHRLTGGPYIELNAQLNAPNTRNKPTVLDKSDCRLM